MKKSEFIKQDIINAVKIYYLAKKEETLIDNTKVNYSGRVYNSDELVNLVDASLEFYLTYGRFSKEFEKRFSEFLNVKYTTLVNSGSSANLVALSSLMSYDLGEERIKEGDSIITVATCFPTTITPILQNKLIPIFVDIDINTLNIDISYLEKAIDKNTSAIFIANTLGNPVNLQYIKEICDRYNLWLIIDECDSLGSKYNDKYINEFCDITTHSFFPAHTITGGYAGAVCTNNSKLNDIIISLTEWGRKYHCINCNDKCKNRFKRKEENLPEHYDCRYIFSNFGYNLRPTDLQASILCAQLDKLENFIKRRKENYNLLYKELKKFSDYFIFQLAEKNSDPSWFSFCITLKDNIKFTRYDLIEYLEKMGIETRLLFCGNITLQPLFKNLVKDIDYKVIGNLKISNYIMNNLFFIGVYSKIEEKQIKYISNCIEFFIKNK